MIWKLNEYRRLVALTAIGGYAQPGDIGGYIPEGTVLPYADELLWVAYDACIGDGVQLAAEVVVEAHARIMDNVRLARCVRVGHDTIIGASTVIGHFTYIKNNCEVGKNCIIADDCIINSGSIIGNDCHLGYSTELGRCVWLGSNVKTASYVRLSPLAEILPDVELNVRNFVQWTGFGLHNRTIVMYIWQGQVVVSIGCQVGVPFDYFAERVANATGTTADSAAIYQAAMPMFKAAKEYLECSTR